MYNLHNCKTTVDKFLGGGIYTRIGVLQKGWPEVAAALDSVLPDLEKIERKRKETEEMIEALRITMSPTSPAAVEMPDHSAPQFEEPSSSFNRDNLKYLARLFRNKKKRELKLLQEQDTNLPSVVEKAERHEAILRRVVDGKLLAPLIGIDQITKIDMGRSILVLAHLLPHVFPYDTPKLSIMEFVYTSVGRDAKSAERLATLYEQAREESRLRKLQNEKKREDSFAIFYADGDE